MTIRWPWVSRERLVDALRAHQETLRDHAATLEHVQRISDDVLAAHEKQVAAADKRFDDLMARFTMLKLQGASEVEPVKPIVAKPVDPVMAAFNEAFAGKGPKVRKQGLAQLERDRAAGLSAAQIITRIHRGNRPADELVDETPTPKRTASGS